MINSTTHYANSDSMFRYQFNKDKMIVSLPLPLGGKKSEELSIPTTLSLPRIDIPDLGIHIPVRKYHLPSFTVPPTLDLTLPLLGLAEASTRISSNFYTWEGSIVGGNNTIDIPNYVGQFKVLGRSPFSLLSYNLEGKQLFRPLTFSTCCFCVSLNRSWAAQEKPIVLLLDSCKDSLLHACTYFPVF